MTKNELKKWLLDCGFKQSEFWSEISDSLHLVLHTDVYSAVAEKSAVTGKIFLVSVRSYTNHRECSGHVATKKDVNELIRFCGGDNLTPVDKKKTTIGKKIKR